VVIWNSIVGKLWLLIIGLVALILIIISVFVGRSIDTSLVDLDQSKKQLQNLASDLAQSVERYRFDAQYIKTVNQLLRSQKSEMILVDANSQVLTDRANQDLLKYNITDLYLKPEINQVYFGGETIISNQEKIDNMISIALPVYNLDVDKIHAVLILTQSVDSLQQADDVKQTLIYAAVIGFLLTTFLAFFLSNRLTQPLIRMKKAADLISVGHYKMRVANESNMQDEIGQLARAFNLMAQKLDETIKALNQEKEHLKSIIRSMIDAVLTIDANGEVVLTNPQGRQLLKDWYEIQWSDWKPMFENQIPEPLYQLFEQVVQGATELNSVLHVKSNTWSVVMTPLYSDDQLRGVVAVLRNVTEQYKLEKLRKDFVANVSHELRTPLSMLQGYSEALLDDMVETPEERKELAQVILDESLRMGRLVRDLLDLARMEAGHLEMKFQMVDVNKLVTRVHRKFTVAAKEQKVSIHMEMSDDALKLIHADEDRLEQVLTNLLDNALRYTPIGSNIYIRASHTTFKDFPAVEFEIEDQGEGIPNEDLPYVFDRFYKADKARTRGESKGTGLGLSIVKNIILAHGGFVNVRSTIGQGTTFTYIIPNDFTEIEKQS
jgi:two-component system sensor histidine kinase ResE